MRSVDETQAALAEASTVAHARRVARQIAPLRGIRGVGGADITRVLTETWAAGGVDLDNDADGLRMLFSTAFEDGLVAIGLTAAALPDNPAAALDLAESWMEMVDDIQTADALGWLVLGPALMAVQAPVAEALGSWREDLIPQRRAATIAAMAALPVPVEGPAAAALRARLGDRRVAFVSDAIDDILVPHLTLWLRDDEPHVRRATARLLREWASVSPESAQEVATAYRGGLPKFLRGALEKGLRKQRRP